MCQGYFMTIDIPVLHAMSIWASMRDRVQGGWNVFEVYRTKNSAHNFFALIHHSIILTLLFGNYFHSKEVEDEGISPEFSLKRCWKYVEYFFRKH